MIRKLIVWFLLTLHSKQRSDKDALQCLIEALPILYTATMLMGFVRIYGPIELPWYMKLWYRIKFYIRRSRAIVVGY